MASQSIVDVDARHSLDKLAASKANRMAVAAWLFFTFSMIVEMFGIGAYVQNDNAGLSIMA